MRPCVLLVGLLATAAVAVAQESVRDTRHNLSVTGPGTIHATQESQVCVFCHTPHSESVQTPLWNRPDPGGTYQMYWSSSLDAYGSSAAAPQPNGSSKLCLSCHDGTIALGTTISSGTIAMQGGITTLPSTSEAYLGRDLSGSHPVSFRVTENLVASNNARGDVPLRSVAEMRTDPLVRLDREDRVQCTTCHDPHHDPYGDFLLAPQTEDLCIACHS